MRLLDLYCCAGGGGRGFADAGFTVVGVDKDSQPRYPFEFVQDDVLDFLDGGGADGFDFVHASPPCQAKTAYRRKGHGVGDGYPNLIPATRERLVAIGLPYCIENVEGFRSELIDPVRICGTAFPELDVQRHRYFECSLPIIGTDCDHLRRPPRYPGATNRKANSRRTVEVGVYRIPLAIQKRAMGVDWDVTLRELSEAIPPAYTEYIGRQLMAHLIGER